MRQGRKGPLRGRRKAGMRMHTGPHRRESPPAIPRRVASQQSPLPLRRMLRWNQAPPVPSTGAAIRRVSKSPTKVTTHNGWHWSLAQRASAQGSEAIDHPDGQWQKSSAREPSTPGRLHVGTVGGLQIRMVGDINSLPWATSYRYAWATSSESAGKARGVPKLARGAKKTAGVCEFWTALPLLEEFAVEGEHMPGRADIRTLEDAGRAEVGQ